MREEAFTQSGACDVTLRLRWSLFSIQDYPVFFGSLIALLSREVAYAKDPSCYVLACALTLVAFIRVPVLDTGPSDHRWAGRSQGLFRRLTRRSQCPGGK
jgi:hypothetical protein